MDMKEDVTWKSVIILLVHVAAGMTEKIIIT